MFGEEGAESPRKAFFYYSGDNLDAVRSGKWKLHVRKNNKQVKELYDLDNDIGETINLYNEYPEAVRLFKKYYLKRSILTKLSNESLRVFYVLFWE